MIFGQTNVVSRLFGPCDLICGDQRIPQERVVDFLTEQLANRGGRRPSLAGRPWGPRRASDASPARPAGSTLASRLQGEVAEWLKALAC